jgi:hypothetical protein
MALWYGGEVTAREILPIKSGASLEASAPEPKVMRVSKSVPPFLMIALLGIGANTLYFKQDLESHLRLSNLALNYPRD